MFLLWLLPALGLAVFFYLARPYWRQDTLIFRPGEVLRRTPADLSLAYETVTLRLKEGHDTYAWWVPRPDSRQAVIFFHGSEGNVTQELPTLLFLNRLGLNALLVEYPGYGGNHDRPSEKHCYEAAEAAWHHMTVERGFEATGIFLFGHSLGGAVAIYLAASRLCGGLVVMSGFTSVPDLAALAFPYLPVRWFVRTKMDSAAHIGRCQCPVLILHSRGDDHIPVDQAQTLYQAAGYPKKQVIFHGSHFGSQWLQSAGIRSAWQQLVRGEQDSWGPG
jgi:hypothetical protein